jgi:hypothetical protein
VTVLVVTDVVVVTEYTTVAAVAAFTSVEVGVAKTVAIRKYYCYHY